MLRSSLVVAKLVWARQISVEPREWVISTGLKSSVAKIVYSSSITLTPGTITLDLEDDTLVVHSIMDNSITDVKNGEMERRVSRWLGD